MTESADSIYDNSPQQSPAGGDDKQKVPKMHRFALQLLERNNSGDKSEPLLSPHLRQLERRPSMWVGRTQGPSKSADFSSGTVGTYAPIAQLAKEDEAPVDLDEHSARGKLWQLYADCWDLTAANNPVLATLRGDHRFNDSLADLSLESRTRFFSRLRVFQLQLERIDHDALPAAERGNASFLATFIQSELLTETVMPYYVPTTHMFGPHTYLVQVANVQPMKNEADFHKILSRLSRFPHQVRQMIDAFDAGVKAGVTITKEEVELIADQCDMQSGDEGSSQVDSAIFRALKPKIVKEFSEDNGYEPRLAQLEGILENEVAPAYRRLATYLRTVYAPHARVTLGIWSWPRGSEHYEDSIEYFTSQRRTADEMHRVGLAEVDRIAAEIDAQRKRAGDVDGTLSNFLRRLQRDEHFAPASSEDILRRYILILAAAEKRVQRLFHNFPRAKLQVREVEAFREATAPAAHYYPPSLKGKRGGIFYCNTSEPSTRRTFDMESTALHEGVPGHHFQIATAQELYGLPRLRRQSQFFTVPFIEGWGLYAEYLGEEMGFYKNVYNRLGRLSHELMRAIRLVVDTGIHHLRWSRDDAFQYIAKHTSMDEDEIDTEIDRYAVMPGQALSYKTGELAIRDALQRAQQRLGEDLFEWPRFHDAVLCGGSVSLPQLHAQVDAYIADALKSTKSSINLRQDASLKALERRENQLRKREEEVQALEKEIDAREQKATTWSQRLAIKEMELAKREELTNSELAYHASTNWKNLKFTACCIGGTVLAFASWLLLAGWNGFTDQYPTGFAASWFAFLCGCWGLVTTRHWFELKNLEKKPGQPLPVPFVAAFGCYFVSCFLLAFLTFIGLLLVDAVGTSLWVIGEMVVIAALTLIFARKEQRRRDLASDFLGTAEEASCWAKTTTNIVLLVLCLFSFIMHIFITAQAIGTAVDFGSLEPPGQLWPVADVNNLNEVGDMHIYCLEPDDGAAGMPTVILESAINSPGTAWGLVIPEIATFTQVCSYDRKGYGWSYRGRGPRRAKVMVDELNELLFAAKISRPVVYVGWAFGGLIAQSFAKQFKTPEDDDAIVSESDVQGIVFVDSIHPEQKNLAIDGESSFADDAFELGEGPTSWDHFLRFLVPLGFIRLAESGSVSTGALGFPFDTLEKLPEADFEQYRAFLLGYYHANVVVQEKRWWTTDSIDDVAGQFNESALKGLPAAVVSRSQAYCDANAEYKAIQEKLEKLTTNGTSSRRYYATADDFLPFNSPDTIVDAVLDVVARARAKYAGSDAFGAFGSGSGKRDANKNTNDAREDGDNDSVDEDIDIELYNKIRAELQERRVRDTPRMRAKYIADLTKGKKK